MAQINNELSDVNLSTPDTAHESSPGREEGALSHPSSPGIDGGFTRYLNPNVSNPFDVIWYADSDRYIVTDRGGRRVLSVHPSNGSSTILCSNRDGLGTLVTASVMQPSGIASFAKESAVFLFTDFANKRILKLSNQQCTMWGTDELNNKFDTPAGIFISPKGHVLVTDYTASVVHKIAEDGTYISSFGGEYLFKPRSIACDSTGRIYVADESSCIYTFTEDGVPLNAIKVDSDDRIWACRAIAIDKYDNMFVTARESKYATYPFSNEKVIIYDSNGEPRDQFGGNWFEFNCIRGLCFDYKRNRLIVVNGKGNCLNAYNLYTCTQSPV